MKTDDSTSKPIMTNTLQKTIKKSNCSPKLRDKIATTPLLRPGVGMELCSTFLTCGGNAGRPRKILRRKIKTYGSTPFVSINSFAIASPYQGQPVLQTSYA